MPGARAAMLYGYSNTRVKAMESKLIGEETFERMLATKDTNSIIGMLLQTTYKESIEQFGGIKAMDTLIDFVLSKDLGGETSKLIDIAPKKQKGLVTAIVGIWDIENIKTMIAALGSNKSFNEIDRYIINTRYADAEKIKEAMETKHVDAALGQLMKNTPYKEILKRAIETYNKSKDLMAVKAVVEREYYKELGSTILRLGKLDRGAADLVKDRIDMKNILTVLRAKKYNIPFAEIRESLIPNGSMNQNYFEKAFGGAKDVQSLTPMMKNFDLKKAVEGYNSSKNRPLILFEISMMNQIFEKALHTIRHSVLSFGTIIAFFYLKEIEAFTLRILIKSKSYSLTDEEIRMMVGWLK